MNRLLLHELRFRVRGMIGWGIGMVAFGAVYINVYPEVAKQMGALPDLPLYEVLGMSFVDIESYIASVILNFLPILLGIYGIVTGTKTLAGEEDEGTLELIMAQPLSRFQIVTAKSISLAVAIFVILVAAAAADAVFFASVREQSNATLEPVQLFFVVFSAWPISVAIAMMSLFLGSFLPKRRTASVVAAVVVIASYFGKTLSGMVPSLKGVRFLSLFAHFDSTAAVFYDGVKARDIIVLLSLAFVFYGLTLLSFQARNVTVGAWPWQKVGRAPSE